MNKFYSTIILLFSVSFSEYLDVQVASFSYTIGGSYGSCVKFKKSQYDFSDFSNCGCAWAANTSTYSNCHELYYNPQTKTVKYNLYEGGQYNYWTASSDYSCHMYTEEIVLDLECTEMNESECSNDIDCIWVEDFQLENCYGISWNEQDCEALEGCNWWTSNYYGTSNCAGSYQIDASYCENASFLPGDANGDGILNISDIILSVYFIINNQYDIDSDYNQDGVLNVIDIIEAVNNIIGS